MNTENRPPMPPTYMVWAILTTIFCCLPFGIVSILKAGNVSTFYSQGLYDEALKASLSAKKWALIGFFAGGGFILVYIIVLLITFSMGAIS